MRSYLFAAYIFGCIIFCACNNSAGTIETKDSTNMQSIPDNTRNADTGSVGDTTSYDRMNQKMNDSPRVH